jgi:hypothetical protein
MMGRFARREQVYGSGRTDVSLREFVTEVIDGRFRYLQGSVQGHSQQDRIITVGIGAFGVFAWQQIQRRLELLNHENERLLAQQAKTVSEDTYRADERRRREDHDRIDGQIASLSSAVDRSATKEEVRADTTKDRRLGIGTAVSVIAAVTGAVVVLLAVLNYQALHRTNSGDNASVVCTATYHPATVCPSP